MATRRAQAGISARAPGEAKLLLAAQFFAFAFGRIRSDVAVYEDLGNVYARACNR
jgi:hypothetical protein